MIAIAVGFTDQQLSPHAGSALFWGWLLPLEKALAFMHGLLCDARKLTHVSYLRRDPLVPELLGIKRVASQSVLTRFFQGFTSAGDNLRCFRPLWHWGGPAAQPIQTLLKSGMTWSATEVPGTEVAELEYQAMSWPHPRRFVLLRHRVSEEMEVRQDALTYSFGAATRVRPAPIPVLPCALLSRPPSADSFATRISPGSELSR